MAARENEGPFRRRDLRTAELGLGVARRDLKPDRRRWQAMSEDGNSIGLFDSHWLAAFFGISFLTGAAWAIWALSGEGPEADAPMWLLIGSPFVLAPAGVFHARASHEESQIATLAVHLVTVPVD